MFSYRLQTKLQACHSSVHVGDSRREKNSSNRSSFIVSVSNEVPEQPVLSPVSGCIYEKRLIIKYLHESPTDPITGQPLTEDQLIDVKGKPIARNFARFFPSGFSHTIEQTETTIGDEYSGDSENVTGRMGCNDVA